MSAMRLYTVGCILFVVGYFGDATPKTKITAHGTGAGTGKSHGLIKNLDGGGTCPKAPTEEADEVPALPYGGGILNAKGEYIPESIRKVWDVVIDSIATHMDPEGQEVLYHFKTYHGAMDAALSKKDGCNDVADVFHNYVDLQREVEPFFDQDYGKVCDARADNRKNLVSLDKNLCKQAGGNITVLQQVEDFLKPFANKLYHASASYKRKSTKCNEKC